MNGAHGLSLNIFACICMFISLRVGGRNKSNWACRYLNLKWWPDQNNYGTRFIKKK